MPGTKARRIVHVGLPKTASTALQRAVFPVLARETLDVPYLHCTAPVIARYLRAISFGAHAMPSPTLPDAFLASCESLVGWDPHWWERNADLHRATFGAEAHVLLALREPVGYLSSVYLQKALHEGNVMRVDQFFRPPDRYSPYAPVVKFDVASFGYRRLVDLYRDRFAHVTLIPYERISELAFVDDVVDMDPEALDALRSSFRAIRSNRSYSRRGVLWTLAINDFARRFGFSLAPTAHYQALVDLDALAIGPGEGVGRPAPGGPSSGRRVARRVFRPQPWRVFVQKTVDRVLPYERYRVPLEEAPWIDLPRLADEYAQVTGSVPASAS